MDQAIVKKLTAVWDAAKVDERYQELAAEYQILDRRLLAAMSEISPAHCDAVMDYVGAVHAINQQTVIIALTLDEKC